uniref:Phosphoglycolate phosphatase n=1 Tax=Romanomermis culicivorax TaxID=13658 RepID=A0A915L7Y8_ROMCU
MIVGDTIVDLIMGKSAQLGCTIGVLSGVGRREDLAETSDLLIPKVGDLLDLVLKKDRKMLENEQQPKIKNILETAI